MLYRVKHNLIIIKSKMKLSKHKVSLFIQFRCSHSSYNMSSKILVRIDIAKIRIPINISYLMTLVTEQHIRKTQFAHLPFNLKSYIYVTIVFVASSETTLLDQLTLIYMRAHQTCHAFLPYWFSRISILKRPSVTKVIAHCDSAAWR